jgi:hypothetical protein
LQPGCFIHRFEAPDFVITTRKGKLLSVVAASFDDPSISPAFATRVETAATSLIAIATHPSRPELLLLDGDGNVQRWDLLARQRVASKQLPADVKGGQRLAVARDAGFLVVGCNGGQVLVLGTESLEEVITLRNTGHAITRYVSAYHAHRHHPLLPEYSLDKCHVRYGLTISV